MQKHFVYIIYSPASDKFYIGQTSLLPEERLLQHNSGNFEEKYTVMGIPWEIFFVIDCNSRGEALKIERHIKAMKSRKYIENLKKYPELVNKLKSRYKG